jgi:hypothetical protein
MTELLGRIVGNTIVLDAPPPELRDGQEVRIHIEAVPAAPAEPRKAGIMKGEIWMADDFNDIPEGFEDYT